MTATKLSVLVVTADADSAWCGGAGLVGRGFAVRVTGCAEAALRSAAEVPADVVLMDYATPGVDGPTLAGSMRAQPRGGTPPLMVVAVVAVVASGTDAAHRMPRTDGVDLSLWRDAPGVADVIVGLLNRFDDFFRRLHATDGATARRPPTPSVPPSHRPLSCPPCSYPASEIVPRQVATPRRGGASAGRGPKACPQAMNRIRGLDCRHPNSTSGPQLGGSLFCDDPFLCPGEV